MFEQQKLGTLQKIIEEKDKQIESLKEENEDLKAQIDFEKIKVNKGYEAAKNLIIEMERLKREYEQSVKEMNSARDSYLKAREELLTLKRDQKKSFQGLMKAFKK